MARPAGKKHWSHRSNLHDDITVVIAQVVANTDTEQEDDDVYRSESIYLYTGPVAPKEDMPSLEELHQQRRRRRRVPVGGEEDDDEFSNDEGEL